MQPQHSSPPGRTKFWLAYTVIGGLTVLTRPFINHGQGVNFFGVETLYAFIGVPVLASYAKSPEMVTFWYLWLFFLAKARITANRNEDSKYMGWPWLASWATLGLLPEGLLRIIEPFIVYGIARLVVAGWSVPV